MSYGQLCCAKQSHLAADTDRFMPSGLCEKVLWEQERYRVIGPCECEFGFVVNLDGLPPAGSLRLVEFRRACRLLHDLVRKTSIVSQAGYGITDVEITGAVNSDNFMCWTRTNRAILRGLPLFRVSSSASS